MDFFNYKPPKYRIPKIKIPSLKYSLPRKRDIERTINPFKRIREPISAKLRKEVLVRAKNKCEWKGCKKRNGEIKLKFHHIDMDNDNNNPKNIKAYCSHHHDLTHVRNKKISYKDFTGKEIKTKIVRKEKYKEEKRKMKEKYSLIQDIPIKLIN